ncbi:MAG: hypothetical protein LBQ73_04690 [Tannerellaceae bacterium]|jgi:hypothetical protein|nr:hypothetical protein [Tannerellaceae bacterium]
MNVELIYSVVIISFGIIFIVVQVVIPLFSKKNEDIIVVSVHEVSPDVVQVGEKRNHDSEDRKPEELYCTRGKEIVNLLSDRLNKIIDS